MIDHNYLQQQFADMDTIFADIRAVVERGDFTLGKEVGEFEREFAKMVGVKHAIGVGNGTDALLLAMRSLHKYSMTGGEVITTPYSFYATTAMIVQAGYKPVYADVGRDFNIDPDKILAAITPRTVGIVPVHWAGRPCDMTSIMGIANKYNLWVVEDCAHAPYSTYQGQRCGSFGKVNTFSLHPLKNINVWGDGGVIVTEHDEYAAWLRKARNHGMIDRNTCEFWSGNSRLDTVQAVVGKYVLDRIEGITEKRRRNAATLDALLCDVPGIEIVADVPHTAPNYYLYSFHAERRDALQAYLVANGVDAKVHYPVPLHLQPAAQHMRIGGFHRGDMPMAEWCADSTLSLPVHEFITQEQLERMATLVRQFSNMRESIAECEGT